MKLEEYLRQQVMAIGTPAEKKMSRRDVLAFTAFFFMGVAFIAASYVFSEARTSRGAVRPVEGLLYLGAFCVFIAWVAFGARHSPAARARKRSIAKYGITGGNDPFSPEAYARAATGLRGFMPMSYEVVEKNVGADGAAILVLAHCIDVDPKTRLWIKIVSIRSIEEDREAGEQDIDN